MSKILIIKHGAFGDVIQSEGALRDIRENHQGDDIIVLTTPAYHKIFERCPWITRVILDPRAPRWRLDLMWKLRKQLRAEQFDIIYDLQNSSRTAFYFRWFFRSIIWPSTTTNVIYLRPTHIIPKNTRSLDRMAGQLEALGLIVRYTYCPNVSWLADDVNELLADAGVNKPFILIIPSSSERHPQKRWPYYTELARYLANDGFQIVTAPGPGSDELNLAAKIPSIMLRGPHGFINWFELAGVMKQAAFIIGNDTGPSHLAAHLGVPGIAIFGPHTPANSTSIEREKFTVIETMHLPALSVKQVLYAVRLRTASILIPYMTSLQ
jgi:ADP-heptose:LPS heptosyltransferase